MHPAPRCLWRPVSRWGRCGTEQDAERAVLTLGDPCLHAIHRLGELLPELGALRAERRRHPRAESDEQAEEGDDDERRADAAWDAQALEPVHAGGHGDGEEDAEEDGEEERVGEPDEPDAQVHRQHERGRADDVAAAPADRAVMPHPSTPDAGRGHGAASHGVRGVGIRVAGRTSAEVAGGVASRVGHASARGDMAVARGQGQ